MNHPGKLWGLIYFSSQWFTEAAHRLIFQWLPVSAFLLLKSPFAPPFQFRVQDNASDVFWCVRNGIGKLQWSELGPKNWTTS